MKILLTFIGGREPPETDAVSQSGFYEPVIALFYETLELPGRQTWRGVPQGQR